jgi:hypothetical protein
MGIGDGKEENGQSRQILRRWRGGHGFQVWEGTIVKICFKLKYMREIAV